MELTERELDFLCRSDEFITKIIHLIMYNSYRLFKKRTQENVKKCITLCMS